jgi:hypothetical protein
MKNEFKVGTTTSLLTPVNREHADRAIIYTGDIRNPWKSVYGFPTTAATLAAGREMILHCREDEIFDLLAALNDLLADPKSLNWSLELLKELQQETLQKLVRLIKIEKQPLTENETLGLLEDIEHFLVNSSMQTVASRLENFLAPNKPADEIAGVSKMLARLQMLISALEQVKDDGLHVVVFDRRRQPARPVLEARRHEPILRSSGKSTLTAGFLLPTQDHLTLWSYLVVRNNNGQSAIWN